MAAGFVVPETAEPGPREGNSGLTACRLVPARDTIHTSRTDSVWSANRLLGDDAVRADRERDDYVMVNRFFDHVFHGVVLLRLDGVVFALSRVGQIFGSGFTRGHGRRKQHRVEGNFGLCLFRFGLHYRHSLAQRLLNLNGKIFRAHDGRIRESLVKLVGAHSTASQSAPKRMNQGRSGMRPYQQIVNAPAHDLKLNGLLTKIRKFTKLALTECRKQRSSCER